ncbi:MAG: hypothetical protein LLG06_13535 [Desulfobacteraceae bacterium]|nr:hypothetical protein [Desulfobacteraceae bacterium]
MAGGIYTSEKCGICGGPMEDNGRNGVTCTAHKKQFAQKIFVKFPPKVFRRFDNYQEATRFLTGLRFKKDEGTYDERDYQKASPLGFSTQVQKYLEIKAQTVKAGTYGHIKWDLGTAADYFGQTNIKEIGYAELEDFLLAQKSVSDKTRHNLKTNLHAFFMWLVKRKVLRKDQMPDFPELTYTLGYRRTVDKITQEEILEEVRLLSEHSPRIYIGVRWLCTYVSIRPGELRGILESDIDLDLGIVYVRDHKAVKHKGPKVVPLLAEDVALIRSMPRGFPNLPFFRHDTKGKGRTTGTPFGPRLFYTYWVKACQKLGVSGVDLYGGTRHSTMQFLRSVGKSKEDVKVLSDHSTNKALDRYLEKNLDEMRAGYALTRTQPAAPILHRPKST